MGFADTNSIKCFFLEPLSAAPKLLRLFIFKRNEVQNSFFKIIFINPGFAISIFSILLSFLKIISFNFSANLIGGSLFVLDKTIATLVDRSHLNFLGGISTFIPDKLSGNKISFSSLANLILFKILFKYSSNIFILMLYIIVWRTYLSCQKYNRI